MSDFSILTVNWFADCTYILQQLSLVFCSLDASDYAPVEGFVINFAAGQTSIGSEDCVTISLLEDDIIESDQQFSAILSSANALVDVSEAVIVITNTNSKLQ